MENPLRCAVFLPAATAVFSVASWAQPGWFIEIPYGEGNTLHAVATRDAQTAIAVGVAGTILRTDDGGQTWISQDSGTKRGLNGVFITDTVTATAVGNDGTILRTTDGGATWNSTVSGTATDLYSILYVDSMNGTAVGGTPLFASPATGAILHTTDGGESWTVGSSLGMTFRGVAYSDPNDGVIVGSLDAGYLCPCTLAMQTTDGGLTWVPRHQGGSSTEVLDSVSYADADHVVAVGGYRLGARIVRSTDGGATWTEQMLENTFLSAVSFADPEVGFAVGSAIQRTTDSGATWQRQTPPSGTVPLLGVSFVDALNGIAVGAAGLIIGTSTGGE